MDTDIKEKGAKMTTMEKELVTEKIAAKKTAPAKTSAKKHAPGATSPKTSGIRKEYQQDKNVCRVTFRLPKIAASGAKNVCVVGDFNNWGMQANPMKRLPNGDYTVSLELETGKEYHFRYLIDQSRWENDWNADKYVRNPYGDSDNSVVVV